MLCFSHDWSGDPLSKTHLMRLMARDNRVLWVNSIGYRTPTASRADLSRAFWKLAGGGKPVAGGRAEHLPPTLWRFPLTAIPAFATSTEFLRLAVARDASADSGSIANAGIAVSGNRQRVSVKCSARPPARLAAAGQLQNAA